MNLNTIDQTLKSRIDAFADSINQEISATLSAVDKHMQNSSRLVAEAVTDTVKVNHDDQRGLMQAGFSDNKSQIQTVVARLENLENLITTPSPQAPDGHSSGELLAAFLILSCLCWHR